MINKKVDIIQKRLDRLLAGEKLVPGKDISPELYERAIRIFKKSQEHLKAAQAEGYDFCPGCDGVLVQKGRWCAVCEAKIKGGKHNGQGRPEDPRKDYNWDKMEFPEEK